MEIVSLKCPNCGANERLLKLGFQNEKDNTIIHKMQDDYQEKKKNIMKNLE